MTPASSVLVDGHRVGIQRFGSVGGWPLVWCHGGLSSALDGKFFDAAGQQCGADVLAIDRPGIGRSDRWDLPTIAYWPQLVEEVANSLGLEDFAVAGWSAGGPYALACAAAMPHRVRAVATLAGMAPLECTRHVFELKLWADRVLIPAARWSPRAAAALVWLGRWAPDRYLADTTSPRSSPTSCSTTSRRGSRSTTAHWARSHGAWAGPRRTFNAGPNTSVMVGPIYLDTATGSVITTS